MVSDEIDIMDIITTFAFIIGILTLYFTLKIQNTPVIKGFMIHEFKDPVYYMVKGCVIKIRVCNYGSKTAYNIKFTFLDSNKNVLTLDNIVKKYDEEKFLKFNEHNHRLNQLKFMVGCLNEKINQNLETQNNLTTANYKLLFDKFILDFQYEELRKLNEEIKSINSIIQLFFGDMDNDEIKDMERDFRNLYRHLERPLNIFFQSRTSLEPEKMKTFEIYQDKNNINYFGGNLWDFDQIKYLSVSYDEAFKHSFLDSFIIYLKVKFNKKYDGKVNKIIELEPYDNYSQTMEELEELKNKKTIVANAFFNSDIYKIWLENLNYNNRNYMKQLRLKYGSDMYLYISHYNDIKDCNLKTYYLDLLRIIMNDSLFLDTIRDDAEMIIDRETNFKGTRIRI